MREGTAAPGAAMPADRWGTMRVNAVVAAGGHGSRFAVGTAGTPKQFLELAGSPMYVWSLLALSAHSLISRIALVVPPQALLRVQQDLVDLRETHEINAEIIVTEGGATRQESVYKGLTSLSAGGEPDYVLIHDAARPFVDVGIIDAIIKKVLECGACTLGIPATDSIKRVRDDKIVETLNREEMLMIQTPQAGRYQDLVAAHEKARETGYATTDDATLLESIGLEVAVVPGSPYNIKVTQPLDLVICEALANSLLKDRL